MTTPLSHIRNFSIIAHIDHGKSTLADRLIQFTGGLTAREMSAQVLDNMDIEKERGITIKAQTVRLKYKAHDGETYELNLMDTPGHVDFAYEVSRSLAACEGALLVVDAAQGVEAQTLANVYQSIEHDHEIVPVINKIDLPAADVDKVKAEIEDIIGLPADEAVLASAKSGIGIEECLEAIVTKIPPPKGDAAAPLLAMLVDSWYDPYLGVVILVRVVDGTLKKGQQIKFMQAGTTHLIDRVGCFTPKREELSEIGAGELALHRARSRCWRLDSLGRAAFPVFVDPGRRWRGLWMGQRRRGSVCPRDGGHATSRLRDFGGFRTLSEAGHRHPRLSGCEPGQRPLVAARGGSPGRLGERSGRPDRRRRARNGSGLGARRRPGDGRRQCSGRSSRRELRLAILGKAV